MTHPRRLALAMSLLVVVTSCVVSVATYYLAARAAPDGSFAAAAGVLGVVAAAAFARLWHSPLPDVAAPADAGKAPGPARHRALVDSDMAQAIIEGTLDAFVQTDERCVILNWSPRAEALMGWTRREAVGRSVDELVFPESQRALHRQWVCLLYTSPSPRD